MGEALERVKQQLKLDNKGGTMDTGERKSADDKLNETVDFVTRTVKLKELKGLAGDEKRVDDEALTKKLAEQVKSEIAKEITPLKQFFEKYSASEEKRVFYNEFVKPIQDKIESVEARLIETPKERSPIDVYREFKNVITETSDELKSKLGIAPGATSDNIPGLLQVEEKRLEREEKQRQHEKELKELERRYKKEDQRQEREWQKEDQRFKLQYNIDLARLAESKKVKGKAVDTLQDLGNAVIEALGGQETGEGEGAEKKVIQENVPMKEDGEIIPCPECKKKVYVPKGVDFVICPECQSPLGIKIEE